jgi:hypothetical protein
VRMGAAIEPRRQTINIDRRSYREVLQACFRQAPVATRTQPKGMDAYGLKWRSGRYTRQA